MERTGPGAWRWGLTEPRASLRWVGELRGTAEGGVEAVDGDAGGYWVTAQLLAALDPERRWVEYDAEAARWRLPVPSAAGAKPGSRYNRATAEGAQGAGRSLADRAPP